MIELTRLNGNPLAVNCDLIKYIEASPDTTLTLVTGEKIVVRESPAEVVARSVAHRARVLRASQNMTTAAHAASAVSAGGAHVSSLPPKTAAEEDNRQ